MPAVNVRRRPVMTALIAALAVVLLAAVVAVVVSGGNSTRTVRADFVEAPGLYPGNHVDVLGIPVGTISSVRATPSYVEVTMAVDSNVKLPAGAGAVIMAPQVVADRFVQIIPAYTGGPTLAAGQTIPVSRTVIPESVNAQIAALNTLAYQLGPNGANKNGALTQLLSHLATQLKGNGPDFHAAVVNFSQALHGISAASPQLASLLTNLGQLSQALAANSGTYQSFSVDLASVSTLLANDRADIGAVLSNLQQALGSLSAFVNRNSASLGVSLTNLQTLVSALAQQQKALASAFDLGPLALQNLDNAINKSAPGGPALRSRYDPVSNTNGLFNTVCGNSAIRFLVVLAAGTQTNPLTPATPVDTVCAVGNALTALTPPPGAATGPNLTLSALAGG
ncbi:MAG: MCE family protein [Acidimicrobiales bacterium]